MIAKALRLVELQKHSEALPELCAKFSLLRLSSVYLGRSLLGTRPAIDLLPRLRCSSVLKEMRHKRSRPHTLLRFSVLHGTW